MTDVPSRSRDVEDPYQASGVYASEPHASAVKTASNPASSAAATSSAWFSGGRAPQYPSCNPSFIASAFRVDPMLKPNLEPVLLEGVTVSSSSPTLIDHREPPLSAPLTLSFDCTRSVGATLGKFFTALRERRILGVRGSDGRVHVPPAEYDPVTYEPLGEMVPVSAVGTVASWTWQPEPLEGQPLDRPFAWALIKLDGADTLLMHAVDAGEPDAIHVGSRVHVHWADEPVGAITDIAYFA